MIRPYLVDRNGLQEILRVQELKESLPAASDLLGYLRDNGGEDERRRVSEYEVGDVTSLRTTGVVVGDTGILPITGPIEHRSSIWSYFGYVTSTEDLIADISTLLSRDVKRIVFDVDSPGGLYSGTPEAAMVINEAGKDIETVSVANSFAASGAIWLASSASRFFSLGSGYVGSVGALVVHRDMSAFFDEMGTKFTIIRNPKGKADFNDVEPLGDETRAHHQEEIDHIATLFRSALAKYRGVSTGKVKSDFGQGRMVRANLAVEAGMIDGIVNGLGEVLPARIKSKKRQKISARLEMAKRVGRKAG